MLAVRQRRREPGIASSRFVRCPEPWKGGMIIAQGKAVEAAALGNTPPTQPSFCLLNSCQLAEFASKPFSVDGPWLCRRLSRRNCRVCFTHPAGIGGVRIISRFCDWLSSSAEALEDGSAQSRSVGKERGCVVLRSPGGGGHTSRSNVQICVTRPARFGGVQTCHISATGFQHSRGPKPPVSAG
jgi:hypothetical protein